MLVVRVHPDWLERQQLPPGRRGPQFWKQRYESINDFERTSTATARPSSSSSSTSPRRSSASGSSTGSTSPSKEWKFSAADVAERQHWDAYMDAYEEAITATSTPWAPWYVIPADHKDLMRMLVAGVVVHTIRSMKLTFPTVSEEQHESNMEARRLLEAEGS